MFEEKRFLELKDRFEKENCLQYFSKGQRSVVYRANLENKEVIIKVEKQDSGAINRISNEISWLKILNKQEIGPELVSYGKDFLIEKFIQGVLFRDWIAEAGREEAVNMIIKILEQCRKLDELQVSKEEMHHPFKHIIISDEKPVMIDFERCHKTPRPKNVTQFFQYLASEKISEILSEKCIMIKDATQELKNYKNDYSEENFLKLLELLK